MQKRSHHLVQSSGRRIPEAARINLDAEAEKLLMRFGFENDGVAIEVRMQKRRRGRLIKPVRTN